MFTENTIRDVEIGAQAPIAKALADKLLDLDKNRIHRTDDLIIRKAVFGLLETVAVLERRLIALEGPEAHAEWTARLEADRGVPTPDERRLGE